MSYETDPDYVNPDTRNVIDEFKGLSQEEIKARIKRNNFSIACFNIEKSIHIGTMVRISNCFAASRFIFIGRKKWSKLSDVGTRHYENMFHCETVDEFFKLCERENILPIAVDYLPGISVATTKFEQYPPNCCFIFGAEASGLTKEIIDRCPIKLHIDMFGSVRSFAVSQAAAIIAYDWRLKHLAK